MNRIFKKPKKPDYATCLARVLRANSTPAETMLWEHLRNRHLNGLKFKRQKPIGRYILDFYCPSLKLGIEIDGLIHNSQKRYDADRESLLAGCGVTLLRFSNDQVLYETDSILKTISLFALHRKNSQAQQEEPVYPSKLPAECSSPRPLSGEGLG